MLRLEFFSRSSVDCPSIKKKTKEKRHYFSAPTHYAVNSFSPTLRVIRSILVLRELLRQFSDYPSHLLSWLTDVQTEQDLFSLDIN